MQPNVMILDEPTSFIDPVGAQKIFDVINELNKKLGITVILVEHRLDLASKYANHVIVMDEGKVVLDGEPREVFNSDSARLIGVGIPKATRLYQILKEKGVSLKKVPVNSEEASQLLREVLTHDRG
jgi:energy-coupling factor transporter ATP-binding protein EcfA2